jgi:hypothetical protein
MRIGFVGIFAIALTTMLVHTFLPLDCSKVKPSYEAGVRAGIGMTIYLANNGVTNLPIDKMVEEAWSNRKAKK